MRGRAAAPATSDRDERPTSGRRHARRLVAAAAPLRHAFARLACAAVLATTPAFAEETPGTFGFTIEVDADGLFDPVLRSVTVVSVATPSPAASAGIAARDRIVAADGHAVAGAKARELEPLLHRRAGESLVLELQRPGGARYEARLVAAKRAGS